MADRLPDTAGKALPDPPLRGTAYTGPSPIKARARWAHATSTAGSLTTSVTTTSGRGGCGASSQANARRPQAGAIVWQAATR